MVYKKIQNSEGNYINNEQVRFDILEAHEAYTPQGLNVGWDVYETLHAAAISYGLTYDPIAQPGRESCI